MRVHSYPDRDALALFLKRTSMWDAGVATVLIVDTSRLWEATFNALAGPLAEEKP